MCKKWKLDETTKTANQHFNSANWHKRQNVPKYVLFRSKLIKFEFFLLDKIWPNLCLLTSKATLAFFLSSYTSINREENTKFKNPLSLNIKENLEVLLSYFLFLFLFSFSFFNVDARGSFFRSHHLVFTMALHPFEEGPFDLTTRDMGLELRYGLGKLLGTQNCPTLVRFPSLCLMS